MILFLIKKYHVTIQTCTTQMVNSMFLIKKLVLIGIFKDNWCKKNKKLISFGTAFVFSKILKVRNYTPTPTNFQHPDILIHNKCEPKYLDFIIEF